MKRILVLLFFGLFLTGCYSSSLTMVGPATGVASGKVTESALSSSFNYAVKNGYNHVITMDGDMQHSPLDINKLYSTKLQKKSTIYKYQLCARIRHSNYRISNYN